jgi:DNA invertase Pin-like site-specific DNA recombinase
VKAAIYARVSTTDQNCEMQLNAVREFISRHGWENAGEYVDEGWSGAKAEQTTIRQANGGCGKAAV